MPWKIKEGRHKIFITNPKIYLLAPKTLITKSVKTNSQLFLWQHNKRCKYIFSKFLVMLYIYVMHIYNFLYEYGSRNKITFVEKRNKGPGANKSKRVKWMKYMTEEEVNKFTDISYIDNEGWLNNIPSSFNLKNRQF